MSNIFIGYYTLQRPLSYRANSTHLKFSCNIQAGERFIKL